MDDANGYKTKPVGMQTSYIFLEYFWDQLRGANLGKPVLTWDARPNSVSHFMQFRIALNWLHTYGSH